jgi:hypothetical protein
MNDFGDWTITRQHIEDLLPLMRLQAEDVKRLRALPYPLPFGVVADIFESLGVDLDVLTNRAGGSP